MEDCEEILKCFIHRGQTKQKLRQKRMQEPALLRQALDDAMFRNTAKFSPELSTYNDSFLDTLSNPSRRVDWFTVYKEILLKPKQDSIILQYAEEENRRRQATLDAINLKLKKTPTVKISKGEKGSALEQFLKATSKDKEASIGAQQPSLPKSPDQEFAQRGISVLTAPSQGATGKSRGRETKYEKARVQMDEIIDSFGRELEFFNEYKKREQAFLRLIQNSGGESRSDEYSHFETKTASPIMRVKD